MSLTLAGVISHLPVYDDIHLSIPAWADLICLAKLLVSIMACKVLKLDDELKEHGLTRGQLNIPCSLEVSRALAMKIDDWKLLAPFIGLSEQDTAAIQEDNRSHKVQSLASLTTWWRKFGSKATYLMLAEGLEKIERLDLVRELCVLFEDSITSKSKGIAD